MSIAGDDARIRGMRGGGSRASIVIKAEHKEGTRMRIALLFSLTLTLIIVMLSIRRRMIREEELRVELDWCGGVR